MASNDKVLQPVLLYLPPGWHGRAVSGTNAIRQYQLRSGAAIIPLAPPTGVPTAVEQKVNKRCRYWPKCLLGADCSFYHPTMYCKKYPSCKFGDQCLNIHPNCKFDPWCFRRNCPFIHTMDLRNELEKVVPRRPAVPAAPTSKIRCFIPDCSKVDCRFNHPRPCRYGEECYRNDCVYFHPQPDVEKEESDVEKEESEEELCKQSEVQQEAKISNVDPPVAVKSAYKDKNVF